MITGRWRRWAPPLGFAVTGAMLVSLALHLAASPPVSAAAGDAKRGAQLFEIGRAHV